MPSIGEPENHLNLGVPQQPCSQTTKNRLSSKLSQATEQQARASYNDHLPNKDSSARPPNQAMEQTTRRSVTTITCPTKYYHLGGTSKLSSHLGVSQEPIKSLPVSECRQNLIRYRKPKPKVVAQTRSKSSAQQRSYRLSQACRVEGRKGWMEQTTPKERHHNPNKQVLLLTY